MLRDLSAAYVRTILDYNPRTGDLMWKLPRPKVRVGMIAGCRHISKVRRENPSEARRITISVDCRRYLASRVIWLWVTGEWPDNEIDHRDGDGWNNRWDNLRLATRAENNRNVGMKRTNSVGIKGVSFSKQGDKYRARIVVNREEINLGIFERKEDAERAYKAAAKRYFGEFARI